MRHSLFLLILLAPASLTCAAPTLSIELGPVNGVLIENDGHHIAIYGWKAEDATLAGGAVERLVHISNSPVGTNGSMRTSREAARRQGILAFLPA